MGAPRPNSHCRFVCSTRPARTPCRPCRVCCTTIRRLRSCSTVAFSPVAQRTNRIPVRYVGVVQDDHQDKEMIHEQNSRLNGSRGAACHCRCPGRLGNAAGGTPIVDRRGCPNVSRTTGARMPRRLAARRLGQAPARRSALPPHRAWTPPPRKTLLASRSTLRHLLRRCRPLAGM